jgi:hypothetical protein
MKSQPVFKLSVQPRAVARNPQSIFSTRQAGPRRMRGQIKAAKAGQIAAKRGPAGFSVVAHGDGFNLFAPLWAIRHDLLIFGLLHSRRRG